MLMPQSANRFAGFVLRVALFGCVAFGFLPAQALSQATTAITSNVGQNKMLIVDDRIDQALTAVPADAVRGRAIVTNRQLGLCLLCHKGQFKEELTAGNVAPSFDGISSRYSTAQLRLRVAKIRHLYPQSIMPNMYEIVLPATEQRGGQKFVQRGEQKSEQRRVAEKFDGQPILTAEQVEDVVAFLKTLQ
jgi:L-cysteine S-thiosulfotransferase